MRDKGLFKVIVVPNFVSLGYRGWATIGINVDPLYSGKVAEALANHPSVHLVTHALGTYNLIIAVAFRTLGMLTNFVSRELNSIEGIVSKETMLITRPIKYYRYRWPGYVQEGSGRTEEDIFTCDRDKPQSSDLDMKYFKYPYV
jgi:DNA-binding Lrp family transcriptional regulator